MNYQVHTCKVLSEIEIAPHIFEVWVKNKALALHARPGQFLHIQCGDPISLPLRRPISICDVNEDTVRFIYEVKGRGTEALSRLTGDLNILGPLGNSFTIDKDSYKRPAVIGGGIGIYPLLLLTKKLQNASVYLGFRNKNLITLYDDFNAVAPSVSIATDDGSYGFHGFSIDQLKMGHQEKCFDIIYACGPKMMLKAVKEFAEANDIRCQISMEERMGCGIGACLTCTCETPTDGVWKYKRVCRNGPVFWSKEVVL